MSTENRLTPRLELLGFVPGEITVLAPIALRDLGPRGVQVESSYPLLLNSVHELRLHLGDSSLVIKGRVAHCRVADIGAETAVYRAGLEFIDAPDYVAAAIEVHLDRLAKARKSPDSAA